MSNPVSSFASNVSGKSGLKIERGGGWGEAIFSELKIADFPETLDHTPNVDAKCWTYLEIDPEALFLPQHYIQL